MSSDRFTTLGLTFPLVDEVKDKLKIVIFGPYKPEAVFNRLERFRNHLITIGYTQTSLVADLHTPVQAEGQGYREYLVFKCQYWLENADVVLFVLFREGRLEGVATEFTHLIDNLDRQMWRTVVFYEQHDISSMIGGRLDLFNQEIKSTDFDGDEDLHQKATGFLIDYLKKLYYQIRDR